jgi:hypothetical protein
MGYVYLIGSTKFGWYKIGKSKIPEIRIRDLGILLPFKVEVIKIWKAEDHHSLEKLLHEMHNANKINGEWFEFSKIELQQLIESIPNEACVNVSEDVPKLDKFSNVLEDVKSSKRVLGLKVQKLRGNFTAEEREQKRQAAIEQQRLKKIMRLQEEKQCNLF